MMRAILGSLLLFFNLFGSYEWRAYQDKREVVQNESVEIMYECIFDNEAYNYAIEFKPQLQSETYLLIPKTTKEFLLDSKRHNIYTYILQPKESLSLELQATMLKISSQEAKEGTLGRDNDVNEYFNAQRTIVTLPKIDLHVEHLSTKINGDFTLHVELSNEHLQPYEPLHVSVTIEGEGNFNDIKPFSLHVDGAKIYTDKIEKELTLTPNGYRGKITQRFAISSAKSFTLEPFKLKYYNTGENRLKELSSKKYFIKIEKKPILKTNSESNATATSAQIDYLSLLNYVGCFVLGFFAALLYTSFNRRKKSDSTLKEKIQNSKNLNELRVLLISSDEKLFFRVVEDSHTLAELKKESLKIYLDAK